MLQPLRERDFALFWLGWTVSLIGDGFFMVYINSFNEWHEGTAFEPTRDYRTLSPTERETYHNSLDGDYRIDALSELLKPILR